MNKACLVGRITSKPELRYTNSDIAVSRFTVAVNRTVPNAKGEKETDFINILTWRKQAENVCQYLDKGSLVSIEGRIQTGSYDDKEGKKVYTFDIVADNVQFLDSKKEGQAVEKSPRDFAEREEEDPFSSFGSVVSIDDNFLD